jgi:NAD(P)H dehydrogenase (quinone)
MRDSHAVLVTGATGNIGSRVVANLAAQGVPVRAMVYHADDRRTDNLRAMPGVQVVAGDLTRAPDVMAALGDCRRVYFGMAVSPLYLAAAATVGVAALASGSVDLLVNMSQMTVSQMSLSSTSESGQQRLQWLSENILNWSGLPVTHVRPTVFMENPLFSMVAVTSIQRNDTIRLPFGNARTSPVAALDVAEVVAHLLAGDPAEHVGHVYQLTGAASRDMTAIAAEFSAALGRQVTYVDVPYDEWLEHDLKPLGLPPHVQEHIATMARLHKQNRYDRVSHDISELLGRPPSGFGTFVRETPALRGASVPQQGRSTSPASSSSPSQASMTHASSLPPTSPPTRP